MCDECGCQTQQDRNMMFDREKMEHYKKGSDKNIEKTLNEMRNVLNFAAETTFISGDDAFGEDRFSKVEKIIRCLNKDKLGRLLAKHLLEMDETDPDLSINLSDVFLG